MTTSLSREQLVEYTVEGLSLYLREGSLNTTAIGQSLEFDEFEIAGWDRIKRLHFCLSPAVVKFVKNLPDELRRIKTETQRRQVTTRGEVRGGINWGATLRRWSETGYADTSVYTSEPPTTAYDIPENRVLKRLLWVIHETVSDDLAPIKTSWRRERWPSELIQEFTRLYRQNVHLNRMPSGDSLIISQSDMNTARQSRIALYQEGHRLLDQYQRLQADDFDDDVLEVFTDSVVSVLPDGRLFELYCIFQILQSFKFGLNSIVVQPIEPGNRALANVKTETHRFELYHDSGGNLRFFEPIESSNSPDHPKYQKLHDSILSFSEAAKELIGEDIDPVLYRGIPDIVIEQYDVREDSDRLVGVILGECKDSSSVATFKQGLKQLIRYLNFARSTDYLRNRPEITTEALLFTNGVGSRREFENIRHFNGSELRSSIQIME